MVLVVIFLFAFGSEIASVIAADPPGGHYTTRYDHIDIENILNHKRLVQYYAACLLDSGPCTPQGAEFKTILPEAIETNCVRCTEKQRAVTTRSIRRLQKEYPDIWGQLEKRWDPTGVKVKRLLLSENRPIPVNGVPLGVFDRFGDDQAPSEEQEEIVPTPKQSTTSTTRTTTSTTTRSIASTTQATSRTTIGSTSTITVPTITTVLKGTAKPVTSIGPNLVVVNPKSLIDKVIFTADMVIKTVSGVLAG